MPLSQPVTAGMVLIVRWRLGWRPSCFLRCTSKQSIYRHGRGWVAGGEYLTGNISQLLSTNRTLYIRRAGYVVLFSAWAVLDERLWMLRWICLRLVPNSVLARRPRKARPQCAYAVTGYDDRSTAHLKGCKTNRLGDFVNGPSKRYECVHIIVDLSFCAHEGLFWF